MPKTKDTTADQHRAKRRVAAEARRAAKTIKTEMAAAGSKIVQKAIRESVKAPTTRATYVADYKTGMRVTEIAAKYGVSRQTVSQAINGREKFMIRQRARDAIRKAPTIREAKICSACNIRGHQKNSPIFHPENAAA